MPWQLDTSSPMFQSMSPTQQAQITQQYGSGTFDNPPVPIAQEGANLQNTQAATPGIQATSATDQIKAQQASALKNLGNDLANKMTLPSALKKYTALGMSPDDIFTQYLAASPWGLPKESPTELTNMGVSQKVLGQPGQANSFADRYNTRNAITELRNAENLWNQTSLYSQLPFLGDKTASGKAYNSAKQIVTEHLSSLIPGASSAQASQQGFSSTLPNVGDLFGNVGAGGQFSQVEKGLMNTKGYSYKDLGLASPQPQSNQSQGATQSSSPGKDLLTTLITNAGKDITGDIKGATQTKLFGINSANPADAVNNLKTLLAIPQEYGNLASNPLQHATEHPVNTALDLLPFLGLLKPGESGISDAGGGNGGATIKDPSALQKILAPGKIKQTAGAMRDNLVQQSSQAGNTIPGDNILQQLQNWADTIGKPGNPGQHTKIDAILNEAKSTYGGKQIDPADAQKIYNEVDSGYNQKGVQKDAIQSRGDIALRQILRGEIDKTAPGFDKLTNIIGQGYNAEKGQVQKIIKNLPYNAAKATVNFGANAAGFGILKDILNL